MSHDDDQKKVEAIKAAERAQRERERERERETEREIKEMYRGFTKKDWELRKNIARKLFMSSFNMLERYLAPASDTRDAKSLQDVTVGISDIIYAIETNIVYLDKIQINKVSNFLSWAEKFDIGIKQTRPDLDDLPDLPNIPNIKEVVDRLFNGPGRMYTNTPNVLYYCIYDSRLIRYKFHLTQPRRQPMSTDGASEDKVYSLQGKIIEPTCTGASCGWFFDRLAGRGGTRRRNKKRKSRNKKSKKRTNRIH